MAAWLNARGQAWHGKRKFDEALRDYDMAIARDPSFVAAFEQSRQPLVRKRTSMIARFTITEAIRVDPRNPSSHLARWRKCRVGGRAEVRGFNYVLDLQNWKGDRSAYAGILGNLATRIAGEEAAARKFLKDSSGKLDVSWPYPAVEFLSGQIGDSMLLKLATDNDRRTEGDCFLGLDYVLKGRKSESASRIPLGEKSRHANIHRIYDLPGGVGTP